MSMSRTLRAAVPSSLYGAQRRRALLPARHNQLDDQREEVGLVGKALTVWLQAKGALRVEVWGGRHIAGEPAPAGAGPAAVTFDPGGHRRPRRTMGRMDRVVEDLERSRQEVLTSTGGCRTARTLKVIRT